jgi:N-acetylmuramoyl-L-alanine amidase
MSSISPSNITSTITDSFDVSEGSGIGTIANSVQDAASDLIDAVTEFGQDLFDLFDTGFSGFLQNLQEKSDGTMASIINSVSAPDKPVPEVVQKEISAAVEKGDVATATVLMAPFSDEEPARIAATFSALTFTIAGTVVVDGSSSVFPAPYVITDNQALWAGANSDDYTFSYISSVEELIAEFRSIERDVSEMIVHWTDSFTNKNLSAEDIDEYDTAVGHDGIAYHLVIRRDGTLQRGRSINEAGEHVGGDREEKSVGVVFVGGFNVPTGTTNPGTYRSAASLTREQFNTFDVIVRSFYSRFPGGQVLGHNDIDPTTDDPGFDVREFCVSRFNRTYSEVASPSNDVLTTEIGLN